VAASGSPVRPRSLRRIVTIARQPGDYNRLHARCLAPSADGTRRADINRETIMEVQPYVFFNGRCEEALAFYREKLGAEVTFMMRYKDAPPDTQQQIRPGLEDKIMHAAIQLGTSLWMASDGNCEDPAPSLGGFSLSLTVDDAPTAERYFGALGEGGQVVMPFGKTFWSSGFGMVVDRFGLMWMVTLPH
jgi:PhnB protein